MTRQFLLLSSFLLLAVSPAKATISFLIEADLLRTSSGSAAPTSSLFLLVSSTTNAAFGSITDGSSTAIGSLLNGDDRILFRGNLSSYGNGIMTVNPTLDLNNPLLSGWTTGDPLALLWFPTLTTSSSTITAGTSYGLYTNTLAVDGSGAWTTPSDPTTNHKLLFYTKGGSGSDLSPGATASNPANVGNASLTVDAVPEPSRSMLGLIGFGMLALRRRRR